jgi:L-arabinose transport system ATP-binding protein
MICEFAKQGLGVILISSELPEVIGLSDRVVVMRSRRITGEVPREEATEDRLLELGMMESETAAVAADHMGGNEA